jgi:DTW domain-containing protein YfiP
VRTRVPVIVVQHPRERRHPFGTVRLAQLGLADVQVTQAARDADGRTTCPPCAPEGAVLLYPRAGATDVRDLPHLPTALVAVDGTWSTARKVIRDNPWLRALPAVTITPPRRGQYRIRLAPDPARQLSTIEAIVFALREFEPDPTGVDRLLAAFDAMIDAQIDRENAHRRRRGLTPRLLTP